MVKFSEVDNINYTAVPAKQFHWLKDIKNVTIFHHNITVSSLCMYYSASVLRCCHGNIGGVTDVVRK